LFQIAIETARATTRRKTTTIITTSGNVYIITHNSFIKGKKDKSEILLTYLVRELK
jgi:hypothetical protein